MSEKINEKDSELEKLKKKCDMQLDHIHELEKKLKDVNEAFSKYKIDAQNNVDFKSMDSGIIDGYKSGIYHVVWNTFFHAVSNIVKDNNYIELNRRNDTSINNMVVNSKDIKGLIESYPSDISTNKMLKIWCHLGIIRLNERNNNPYFMYTKKGKSIRTIRIKKEWVDLIKESMLHD